MSNYPIDITLACSVALEGGLEKYRKILPPLPQGAMYLIQDWNRALISECKKPNVKKHLGALARGIVLLKNPHAVASIVDKIAVPYRSFYYAKRFIEAYNFASDSIQTKPGSCVMDFGRGLSPLVNLISYKNPDARIYSIDIDNMANEIHTKVSAEFGQSHKIVNWAEIDSIPKNIFLSLGTFAYIPKWEAESAMEYVAKKFPKVFIELDLDKSLPTAADDDLVRELGTEYQKPWTEKDISNIFGSSYKLNTLNSYAAKEGIELYERQFEKLRKSFDKSNEVFLQR